MGTPLRTHLGANEVVVHTTDAMTRESRRQFGSGGAIESAFDTMGRMIERRAVTGATAIGPVTQPQWVGIVQDNVSALLACTYDADSRITSTRDSWHGLTTYDHDPVGQLLASVPEHARAELFTYDPAGNIQERGDSAVDRVYDQGNRLLRKGGTVYTWDNDGQLSEKAGEVNGRSWKWNYLYSGAGQLKVATKEDGTRVEFDYDPFGRRVEKRTIASLPDGGSLRSRTLFVWDGDVLVHEIKQTGLESGKPVLSEKTYVFEDRSHAPMAEMCHRTNGAERDGGWRFHLTDAIGAPKCLIDGAGHATDAASHGIYGKAEAGAERTCHSDWLSGPIRR